MTIKQKIATSIATGAFLGAILTGSAFAADNKCEISGNGNNSTNRCRLVKVNKKTVVQVNSAHVANFVGAGADTGGNSADKNTGGGNVKVDTGSATATVNITNTVNSNNSVNQ